MKKLLLSLIATVFAIGMNATVVETNATSGTWTGDENGYTATINGYKITYLKYENNNGCVAPSADHIRVYKNGKLTIEAVDGSAITSLEFTCTAANYAFDIVVEGGNAIKDGNIISWIGNTTLFEGVTSNGQCRIKSIKINEGTTEPDPTNPTEPENPGVGTGNGTLESPFNPTAANAYTSALAADATSDNDIYVAGKICNIKYQPSSQYGTATFYISEDGTEDAEQFYVYSCYGLENKKFTDADVLNIGDEVIICGKVINYKGDTPETASKKAYIYSLNGKTTAETTEPEDPNVPAYEAVGDGSLENPYTVADIMGMGVETSDGNKYWVKGFILGSATSGSKLNSADKNVDTNIALGEAAGAETFIPVALPAGDMRTALGVATNPQNIGLEVMVYGTLEKYFSTAGVKNVSDYQILGSVPGGNEGALYSIDFTKASMDEFNNEEEDSWETVVYAVDWTNDAYEESDAEVIKLNSNGLVFDAQGGDYWAMVFSVAFDLSEYTGVYAEWNETLNGFYDADYALHFIGTSLQYFLTEDDEYTTSLEYEGNRAANDGTVFTCHFDIPDDFNGLREYVYFSFDFFAYSSSAEYMGQWTVKNFALYGDNGDGIERIEPIKPADMKIFDLMGRQQNKLQKGLNIMNGKKIVVK